MIMMKSIIGAAVVSFFAIGPALAIAPNCEDQLAQLKAQMSQTTNAKASVGNKYNEAQRLCSQHKDEEAQALARQIREELAGTSASGSTTTNSGSSVPSNDASRSK